MAPYDAARRGINPAWSARHAAGCDASVCESSSSASRESIVSANPRVTMESSRVVAATCRRHDARRSATSSSFTAAASEREDSIGFARIRGFADSRADAFPRAPSVIDGRFSTSASSASSRSSASPPPPPPPSSSSAAAGRMDAGTFPSASAAGGSGVAAAGSRSARAAAECDAARSNASLANVSRLFALARLVGASSRGPRATANLRRRRNDAASANLRRRSARANPRAAATTAAEAPPASARAEASSSRSAVRSATASRSAAAAAAAAETAFSAEGALDAAPAGTTSISTRSVERSATHRARATVAHASRREKRARAAAIFSLGVGNVAPEVAAPPLVGHHPRGGKRAFIIASLAAPSHGAMASAAASVAAACVLNASIDPAPPGTFPETKYARVAP